MKERTSLSRNPVFLLLLAGGTVLLALVSLSLGRFAVPFFSIPRILFFPESVDNPVFSTVILNVRVPRVLAALLVGSSLAVAGSSYQALFRNPMVSPDILGASAGAGFGACLAILLGQSFVTVQLSSFCFGLASVLVSWSISRAVAGLDSGTLSLVLTGMVVSSLFTAFISITKYLADPESKLPAITFWLMGGLSSVKSGDLLLAALPMLLGLVPLIALRWRLNVLSFGDDEARSLGVNTGRLRLAVIVCSTLLTSSAVSVAGMVGWVGLVVPHLARMIVGPDCRMLIPVSLFIGAAFMLGVDDVARCLFPLELPLGILTALVGAPFFLFLLVRGRKGWA